MRTWRTSSGLDEAKSFELDEVVDVSDVQGGERQLVNETTGCDPGVVDRSRSAPLVGVGHDLAPLAGNISAAGQERAGGQRALAGAAGDEQAAVLADPGDGPGVAVGDSEVAVVASGGDPVAETDPLTTTRDGLTSTLTRSLTRLARHGCSPGAVAAVADGCVERSDLVAGVGDDELVAVISADGADGGQGCGAFDLAGMEDDLAALEQCVEDLTGPLTSAHEQAEVGVRGIGEPVDRLELVVRCGSHPACGEVEDAAAADGRQLVAVAQERDGGVGSVGDGEQRAGGVLVEHAGLVDEEDVAGEQTCAGLGLRRRSRDQWPSSSHR